jgi:hypothetical protein
VTRLDWEAHRRASDRLVFVYRELDRFDAALIGTLAEKLGMGRCGDLLDALVHVPDKRLVAGRPSPSKEAAEAGADRHVSGQPEGLAPLYQVLAVRAS